MTSDRPSIEINAGQNSNIIPDDYQIYVRDTSSIEELVRLEQEYLIEPGRLSAPSIDSHSFTTQLRSLSDGTIVADVSFTINNALQDQEYEVRWTS